jgi:hypothetical protein
MNADHDFSVIAGEPPLGKAGSDDSSGDVGLARDSNREIERKRSLLKWFSLLAVPALAYYAIEDLVAGRLSEGLAEFLIVLVMLSVPVAQGLVASPDIPARIVVICSLAVLTWELSIGGGNGFAMLWFFAFPLFSFSLLGGREGKALVVLSVVLVVFFSLLWPASRGFYVETGGRLVVAYVVVTALAWAMETSRHHYDISLRREHEALKAATAQVHRLEGMLPICAWCKKVRDDDGYWSEVEAYFGREGPLCFTHSICPACADRAKEEFRHSKEDLISPAG